MNKLSAFSMIISHSFSKTFLCYEKRLGLYLLTFTNYYAWDGGILGCLEDRRPSWKLLVPLWWLHLAQEQFCTTQGVQVGHGGGVVVIRTPVRPNSNSAEFRAWMVLNYSSYVVLG